MIFFLEVKNSRAPTCLMNQQVMESRTILNNFLIDSGSGSTYRHDPLIEDIVNEVPESSRAHLQDEFTSQIRNTKRIIEENIEGWTLNPHIANDKLSSSESNTLAKRQLPAVLSTLESILQVGDKQLDDVNERIDVETQTFRLRTSRVASKLQSLQANLTDSERRMLSHCAKVLGFCHGKSSHEISKFGD